MSMTTILGRLRSHPMVNLDAERIRTRAYYLSQSHERTSAEENWLRAEDDETYGFLDENFVFPREPGTSPGTLSFDDQFENIFSWSTNPQSPRPTSLRLGKQNSRGAAAFCLRGPAQAKFDAVAHVIPEQLGTGSLTTFDECDVCNQIAGRDYESDLGNMLIGERAISMTPTKKGTAKLKRCRDGAFVGGDRDRSRCWSEQDGDPNVTSHLSGPNTLELQVVTPPFRPRRVGKALAKMTRQALPSLPPK